MNETRPYSILVVDDDQATREAHARLLRRFGYEVSTAEDGIGALGMLPLGFDLIVVDAEMPHMDGFEVAERIRADPDSRHLPIVMVTGLAAPDHRRRALSIGINDFITKPVNPDELQLRTKWLVTLKRAYDRMERQRADLEREVSARTQALRQSLDKTTEAERRTRRAHTDTVRRLMIAAEYKDVDTAGHIERIGLYSEVLGRALQLAPGHVDLIRHAAPMHDVGKIGIPDRILLKAGPLDDAEWEIMRTHTTIGEQILRGSESSLLRMGECIAATHHEKWDGTGYPKRLAGDDIPLEGRICAVVDVYDALTMNRPYRAAMPVDVVLEMMHKDRGRHFDPDILDLFFDVQAEITALRESVGAGEAGIADITPGPPKPSADP